MAPPALDLTLILAATTRDMGIGLAGALPWTGLRKEMAYFARVTKRLPPSAVTSPKTHPPLLITLRANRARSPPQPSTPSSWAARRGTRSRRAFGR